VSASGKSLAGPSRKTSMCFTAALAAGVCLAGCFGPPSLPPSGPPASPCTGLLTFQGAPAFPSMVGSGLGPFDVSLTVSATNNSNRIRVLNAFSLYDVLEGATASGTPGVALSSTLPGGPPFYQQLSGTANVVVPIGTTQQIPVRFQITFAAGTSTILYQAQTSWFTQSVEPGQPACS
jgi:hypothetical protein